MRRFIFFVLFLIIMCFIFDSSFRKVVGISFIDGYFERNRLLGVSILCDCKYTEKKIPLSKEEKLLMFIPGIKAVTYEQVETRETCDIIVTNNLDYSISELVIKISSPTEGGKYSILELPSEILRPSQTVKKNVFLSTLNLFGSLDRNKLKCEVLYVDRN